jgi:hypothetical protein
MSAGGYYVGGICGAPYSTKGNDEANNDMIEGVFGLKLKPDDLSLVYSNLSSFSEEQAEDYNNEISKHPNYKKHLAHAKTPKGKIHNEYIFIQLDAMTVDASGNIVLAISSFVSAAEGNSFATNVAICQMKLLAEGGLSNFKVVPRRHTSYHDPLDGNYHRSDYFFSSLVCKCDNIVSVFNDDKKNISNLTDMNKNFPTADKSSLPACADVDGSGKFRKYALFPEGEHVLILSKFTKYIDENTTLTVATRDKKEMLLLKIYSDK